MNKIQAEQLYMWLVCMFTVAYACLHGVTLVPFALGAHLLMLNSPKCAISAG